MTLALNGWRRLGVVTAILWMVGTITFAATEAASSSTGFFVYRGIPIGTTINGDMATLPDGRVAKMHARDSSGRLLAPWEINWDKQSQIPKASEVRWGLVVLFVFAVPIGAWVFIEIIVLAVSWIARGFKQAT